MLCYTLSGQGRPCSQLRLLDMLPVGFLVILSFLFLPLAAAFVALRLVCVYLVRLLSFARPSCRSCPSCPQCRLSPPCLFPSWVSSEVALLLPLLCWPSLCIANLALLLLLPSTLTVQLDLPLREEEKRPQPFWSP